MRELYYNTQEPKETHPKSPCPWCGGTEHIFSVYRDTGSTLYHGDSECSENGKPWLNANFKDRFKKEGSR